jgi:hypothetical protein
MRATTDYGQRNSRGTGFGQLLITGNIASYPETISFIGHCRMTKSYAEVRVSAGIGLCGMTTVGLRSPDQVSEITMESPGL